METAPSPGNHASSPQDEAATVSVEVHVTTSSTHPVQQQQQPLLQEAVAGGARDHHGRGHSGGAVAGRSRRHEAAKASAAHAHTTRRREEKTGTTTGPSHDAIRPRRDLFQLDPNVNAHDNHGNHHHKSRHEKHKHHHHNRQDDSSVEEKGRPRRTPRVRFSSTALPGMLPRSRDRTPVPDDRIDAIVNRYQWRQQQQLVDEAREAARRRGKDHDHHHSRQHHRGRHRSAQGGDSRGKRGDGENQKKTKASTAGIDQRSEEDDDAASDASSSYYYSSYSSSSYSSSSSTAGEPTTVVIDTPEYDPDHPEIVTERMALLQVNSVANGGTGYDDGARQPGPFECDRIPRWVDALSDLLLFQNSSRDCSGSGELPVDSAVLQLRADLSAARALLTKVRTGGDGGLLCGAPAKAYEVYGTAPTPPPSPPAPPATTEAAATAAETPEAAAEPTVAIPVHTPTTSNEGAADGVAEEKTAALPVNPLPPHLRLSPQAEVRDATQPLLARQIPLWRRRGAAETALSELIDFLDDRLGELEKRLDDPVDGHRLESVGVPSGTGVDGTQRCPAPPAIEHAYATTVTSTLLSDLFASPSSALTNRAMRVSDAYTRQTPLIHDRFVIDESLQLVYDEFMLRRANLFEPLYTPEAVKSGSLHGALEDPAQSYSVHIDYVRFDPVNVTPPAALLQSTATGAVAAAAASSAHAAWSVEESLLSSDGDSHGDVLAQTLRSHTTLGAATNAGEPHRGSAEELFTALLASRLAARQSSIVTFTAEEYLIAKLLDHYERYRLLRLNLLPHLKSRTFYHEQLTHLRRQPRTSPELTTLMSQLEVLHQKSCDAERATMVAMILLWEGVLQLRAGGTANSAHGQAGEVPFIVAGHDSSAGRSTSAVQAYDPAGNGVRRRRQGGGGDTSATITGAVEGWSAGRGNWLRRVSLGGVTPSPGTAPLFSDEEDEEMATMGTRGGGGGGGATVVPVQPSAEQEGEEGGGGGRRSEANSGDAERAPRVAVRDLDELSGDDEGEERRGDPLHHQQRDVRRRTPTPGPCAGGTSAAASPLLGWAVISPEEGDNDVAAAARQAAAAAAAEHRAPPGRFRFFLRRHGEPQETPYVQGDDVLHYVPEVEGTDLAATPGRDDPMMVLLSAEEGDTTKAGGRADRHSIGHHRSASRDMSLRGLDELTFFQVIVFARSNAAMPPQYVGCTRPRPLTTAKVVFFNETFEIRTTQEPVEMLLHLIPVTQGALKNRVLATVRVKPMLTRSYLLLPLQPPIAFMYKGKSFLRPAGTSAAVAGVVSASTTWTTAQGLSMDRVEQLFLSGAADPLDPEYTSLLRLLRNYYIEVDRNTAEATARGEAKRAYAREEQRRLRHRRRHSVPPGASSRQGATDRVQRSRRRLREEGGEEVVEKESAGGRLRSASTPVNASASAANASGGGRRQRQSAGATETEGEYYLELLAKARGRSASLTAMTATAPIAGPRGLSVIQSDEAAKAVAAMAATNGFTEEDLTAFTSERLRMMRRRWRIASAQAKPVNQVEARLLSHPIPLSDADGYDLLKQARREVAKEDAERGKKLGTGEALFDAQRYYEEPSSVSGLALSPLPTETKLRLWQERQRRMKMTRRPARNIADEELLERYITIPKFKFLLVFDLKPRSQLNPRRVERPKNDDIDRSLLERRQDSRIIVHIMKAYNLPTRSDGTPLEPFVQAGFVYETAYSRSEVGSSPSWFQTVELPFQPLDFDEDTLSMIDDDIVITLYDKVEIPMPSAITTGAVSHETHYRTERRLLGTVRIPFYSLHQAAEARLEGVYPLQTPRWLMGYEKPTGRTPDEGDAIPEPNPFLLLSGGAAAAAASPPGAASTSLKPPASTAVGMGTASSATTPAGTATVVPTVQLYLSLWPPLQREKPPEMSESTLQRKVRQLNVSDSLHYLHEVALRWSKTAKSRIKRVTAMNAAATGREVEPFVFCSTGDLVLSCRFLLPHGGPPPQAVKNVYEAIRYVSLLPFVVDIMTWGDKDVWSTNVELLAMRSGDYEELALLLAHLLRYLAPDRETYVVVGCGEIYAQTIMVLHSMEEKGWCLIDPRTGWITSVATPFGSVLKDVYYVLSHDQMWANIQLSGLPHRMTWDLHNSVYWLPCFDLRRDKKVADCLPYISPIQREVLGFQPADPVKAKEIELDLRQAVRKALLAWRNHRPPAYHRGVEAILRELLIMAEQERCTSGTQRQERVTAAAHARLSEYFGEPIGVRPATSEVAAADAAVDKAARRRGKKGGEESSRSHSRHRSRPARHDHAADTNETDDGGGGRGGVPPAGAEAASTSHGHLTSHEALTASMRSRSPGAESVTAAPHTTATETPSATPQTQRRELPCLYLVGNPVTASYNPSDRAYNQILQQVFEGAVHEVGTDDVSFAAGVYVKSYTGDVCAMWVFLVAICRGVRIVEEEVNE